MDHLGANLAAASRLGMDRLDSWLSDVSGDGEPETSGGRVTGVSLRSANGLVRMHSRHDPVGEAERQLPEQALVAPLVVLIGAGAGFAVDALERRGFAGRVLVLEPSAASLRATLSRRSWADWLDAGRLRFLRGPDYAGWRAVCGWVGASTEAPPIVVQPVLARERPGEASEAVRALKRVLYNANANEAARRAFAGDYLLNTLRNLRHLVQSRDVGELFGRFGGVAAFVLAAGPSLNRNLDELRPYRDRALVIAVDTALRPSLAAGIEPDFVVGVDPGEANLRHLAVGAVPARTHLVAEPSLAPGSFDAFVGRVFTFRVDRHHPWPWLQALGVDRAQLLAWGSVLTTALDLAVRLGCNPVVLFGADFAYTDGQPYCRGTAYEEGWAAEVAAGVPLKDVWRRWMRQPVVVERAVDGRDVETSAHLLAFRDWVAEYCAKHPEVRFVNATGAGIPVLSGAWQPESIAGTGHRPVTIPAKPADRATCRRAREEARRLALQGTRTLRGRGASAQYSLLVRGLRETPLPNEAVRRALAMSTRTPMISRLPEVPLAQHPQEFGQLLQWLDELPDVEVLVEIGSRFGGSLYALAAHLGSPLTAVAIDLPDGPWGKSGSGDSLDRVAAQLRVQGIDAHVVLGDSREPKTIERVKSILAGRAIDVLFVDADHRLAGVAGDLQLYAPLVRPGGLVAMHDVGWPFGCNAVAHAPFDVGTLQTLADVRAAFSSLALGRRSETVTYEWGIGGIWM
jgi:predicted O-methyltransferase YrrM